MNSPMDGRTSRAALFREFSRWMFDERGLAPSTRYKYVLQAQQADEWLFENRQVRLLRASTKDLQAFLWSRKPNPRTRNNIRHGLLCFGDFALDQELSEVNPAMALRRLPEPDFVPKALPWDVIQSAVEAARSSGPRDEVLILLYAYTGARRSELRLLERGNIEPHISAPDLSIRIRGKGRGGRTRERVVPLHPDAADALRRWLHISESARWVFPGRDQGEPISNAAVRDIVWAVGQKAGIPDAPDGQPGLHPHLFRHSVATRMLEAGNDIRTVQEFLGHKKITSTQIYTRVWNPMLREAVLSLDEEVVSKHVIRGDLERSGQR